MAIKQGIARLERLAAERSREVGDARQRELEFRADRERDHLCLSPEYRWVTRDDCFDEEVWNKVRLKVAMADFDFDEVARLESLPTPREDAFQAWAMQAPTIVEQLKRSCQCNEIDHQMFAAADKAKARGNPKGAWR